MDLVHFPSLRSFLHRRVGTNRYLRPDENTQPEEHTAAELLSLKDIILDEVVTGKTELLDEIGQHMQWEYGIAQESVARALAHREHIGSTALGYGVAIPHARIESLNRIHLVYLRLRPPIPYDAPDGAPITDVVAILVPKQAAEEHFRILAEISQRFSDSRFRAQLQRCASPLEVKQRFDAWPEVIA